MSSEMTAKSQQFVNELAQFYRNKNQLGVTTQHLVARLNGRTVNLWDLYSCVLEMGGSFKVNHYSRWDEVYSKIFRSPPSGVNVAVALRQIYQRLLMPYEKVNYSNFTNDVLDDDEDDGRTSRSTVNKDSMASFVLHSSLSYPPNHQNHNANSGTNNSDPLNKMCCALVSGLPNEMDFGLRIATMVAGSLEVDWIANFRFLEILLRCYSLYSCCCEEDPQQLELDRVSPSSQEMVCDEQNCNTSSSFSKQTLVAVPKECPCLLKFWSKMCNDDDSVIKLLYSCSQGISVTEHAPFVQDKIYERVTRIAELVRVLSFNIEKLPVEENCAPQSLIKFVALLLSCNNSALNSTGLIILSNIASFAVTTSDCEEITFLQKTIFRRCVVLLVDSNDLSCLNQALEVTTKLLTLGSENVTKEVTQLFDDKLYGRLRELLTCQHDISVVISTLEFCLALSENHPKILLQGDTYLIKILLNLLNCEVTQHFHSTALEKVIVSDSNAALAPVATPVKLATQLPLKVVTNQPVSMQPSVVDSEAFAMNYLRGTYETNSTSKSNHLKIPDMYTEYVQYSCRNGQRNVISASSFSQVIKKAFMNSKIGIGATLVEGLVAKTTPDATPVKKPGQLASPILKAHLSAPPRGPTAPTPTTTTSAPTTPTSTASPTSTLIKSLLASKLRGNTAMSAAKVNEASNSGPLVVTNTIPAIKPVVKVEPAVSVSSSYKSVNPTLPLPSSLPSPSPSTPATFAKPAITVIKSQSTTTPVATTSVALKSLAANSNSSSSTSNPVTASTAPTSVMPVINTNTVSSHPQSTVIVSSSGSTNTQSVLFSTSQVQMNSIQSGQAPQQYILVRTMIGGQQQQGLVGVPAGSGPIRFILPSSLIQPRPHAANTITMNGIGNSSPQPSPSLATVNTNSNDILLKAVLGSGIANDAPASPPASRANTAKSSPLLNVLLDKGKLPEFATPTTIAQMNSISASSGNTAVLSASGQQPKMYILTTKSGVPIKTIPGLSQASPINNVQPQLVQAQLNSHQLKANIVDCNQTVLGSVNAQPVASLPQNNHNKHTAVQNLPLTNGETCSLPNIDLQKKSTATNSNDLSSIKDIQKTVDDATKLISKRPAEEQSGVVNKKLKLNDDSKNTTNGNVLCTSNVITSNGESNSAPSVINTKPIVVSVATEKATVRDSLVQSKVSQNLNCTSITSVRPLEYYCEWNACNRSFQRPSQVFKHVYDHHILFDNLPLTTMMSCEWGGPGGLGPGCQSKRPKLSLLSHLQDFHCNPNVLHQIAIRNQQLGKVGSTTLCLPIPPPAHPGYAQNAAFLAIQRHAVNYVEPLTKPPITPTTPITVSIRLTAALVLRNLAEHSLIFKNSLHGYESYLSELCVGEGREESRTIAQCLHIILENSGRS